MEKVPSLSTARGGETTTVNSVKNTDTNKTQIFLVIAQNTTFDCREFFITHKIKILRKK